MERLETAVERMREEILRLRTEVDALKGAGSDGAAAPETTEKPKAPRKRAAKKAADE